MKVLVWTGFAFLAFAWTAGAWVLSELTQWSAQLMASGQATEWGRKAAQLPLPEWLSMWGDAEWVRAAQRLVLGMLESAQDALPTMGSAIGWVVPVIWVVWAFGVLCLMLAGGGAHLMMRRLLAPRTQSV